MKDIQKLKTDITNKFILISSDAGSLKKIYKIADILRYTGDIITCSKHRDTDGNLSKINVPTSECDGYGCQVYINDCDKKDLIIIDDICDGGATFLLLAEELKKLNKNVHISLYVTHGIFSKGLDIILDKIDKVYAYHLWSDAGDHSKVNQTKYKDRYFWINYF